MIEMSGQEVTLPAQQKFYMPSQCCRCGKPGTKQVTSNIAVRGFGRKTRSVLFPYCDECDTRQRRISSARLVLFLTCLVIALVVSCLGFVLPSLPKAVLWTVPTVLAVVAAVVLRARAGESVEMPRGAWLSGATNKVTKFFMTHADWAKEFAAGNQIPTLTPIVRKERWPVWPYMLGVAGIAAAVVASVAQPDVYIDNESAAPVQVWIDGKKSIVADSAAAPLGGRPKVSVSYGKHRFGWSAVGASAPGAQTEPVTIRIAGDHLYNPDQTACYYLDVSVYGSATGTADDDGFVALEPFYTFKHVDNWFVENPKSVEMSAHSSSATRVSVQPWPVCKELADRGCGLDVRRDYMKCLTGIRHGGETEAAAMACLATAAKECGAKTKK